MLDEKVLIWRFKRGSSEALCRIYQRYRKDMLKLAVALLHETAEAEDIVHDVFVALAQSPGRLKLSGSLKGYLLTCVANRARNKNRVSRRRQTAGLDEPETMVCDARTPEQWVTCSEEMVHWSAALARLPYEQRETVVLHLRAEMRFGQIARLQGVSVNTAKGRYRYALAKLRASLNGELER